MKIGFVGLGHMGLPMAVRLADAGHGVIGYNRTPGRAGDLERKGARIAPTLTEAARNEVVITMLSDDIAVEKVAFAKGGLIDSLQPGCIHISMSTISTSLSKRLAAAHAARKQRYIAATVMGRPEAAADGKLFVIVAGEPTTIKEVQPIFEAFGRRTFEIAREPWASNLVKISCNLLIANVIESLAEVFVLVRKAGSIDPDRYLDILTGTLFSGPVFEVYGKHILEHDFKPGFPIPLALKDVGLALAEGQELAVPLPSASLVRDRLITALAQLGPEPDWSSLAGVALRAGGMTDPEKDPQAA